jgi:hypothetical protein
MLRRPPARARLSSVAKSALRDWMDVIRRATRRR